MTKENVLYQVYLVLQCLPEEEYVKIPKETLNYIKDNMEYDENIVVDETIPLEEQNIDERTYKFLDRLINEIEEKSEKQENMNDIEESNLKYILEKYKKENGKILKIKDLLEEYKINLKKSEEEVSKLKNINEQLYKSIKKCPFIVRKIFFKDFEKKLLK